MKKLILSRVELEVNIEWLAFVHPIDNGFCIATIGNDEYLCSYVCINKDRGVIILNQIHSSEKNVRRVIDEYCGHDVYDLQIINQDIAEERRRIRNAAKEITG